MIGLLGSVIGLFLGLGLAKLLNALFVAIGIDLPHGSTVFATRTVVVSLLVGTLVTLLASIRPARRATRVPPIAAVREGSVLPPSRWRQVRHRHLAGRARCSRSRWSRSARSAAASRPGRGCCCSGVGVLLLFFGVSMNASKVVRPLAAVLGAPARVDRRRPRDPRARQRDPEPGADRVDGLRADDRPRARHLRGDLRRRESAARSRTPSTSSSSATTRSRRPTPSRRSRPRPARRSSASPA